MVSNIAKYGNTSAGSVPIAMAEAVAEGRIKKGDVVATAGFGAGLTWASSSRMVMGASIGATVDACAGRDANEGDRVARC